MITRRLALGAAAVAPWLTSAATAAVSPPTIEEFVREPVLRGAAISPDGRRIALVGEVHDRGVRSTHIDLINAEDPSLPRTRAPVGEREVETVAWANNERLLLQIVRDLGDLERRKEEWITPDLKIRVRRLMSITAEGKDPAIMFSTATKLNRTNYNLAYVVGMTPKDPRHILMRALDIESGRYDLYRVDVYTGAAELTERGGPQTVDWEIQDGQPVLRWDSVGRGSSFRLLGREPGASEWRPLRNVRRSEVVRPDFEVLGTAFDEPGVFLVSTRGEGDPVAAIRKFDFKTAALGEVVAQRSGLDVNGAFFDGHGRFVAAEFIEDRVAYDFGDKKLAAHFRGIDSFFGRECNVRIVDMNLEHTRFLMDVSGPRLPGAIYYYDMQAQNLQNLGLKRPWLGEERLAKVEMLDVRTRDGTTQRAYLTVPLATGPRPLVVMPHGGPEVRDGYDFDLFAQVFAAQGWLVLQPNFRGSGGYGRAFADAGRRRWGDLMQQDVEDAVAHILATGRADRQKVAIWGASYGGYAALMGATRNPDLYRCAVSVAGVSDLLQSLEDERDVDGFDGPIYQYWVKTMGDPKADAAMLAAASPARRVGEIKAPILLIHGLKDTTVLPNQSKIMAEALKAARKPYEHVEIRGVGHSGWESETMLGVLQNSVAFIGKAFA